LSVPALVATRVVPWSWRGGVESARRRGGAAVTRARGGAEGARRRRGADVDGLVLRPFLELAPVVLRRAPDAATRPCAAWAVALAPRLVDLGP
jgi:hypothetical protein